MSVIFIGVDAFSKQNSFSRRFPRKPFLFDGTSADRVHTENRCRQATRFPIARKLYSFYCRRFHCGFRSNRFPRRPRDPPAIARFAFRVVRAYLLTVSSRKHLRNEYPQAKPRRPIKYQIAVTSDEKIPSTGARFPQSLFFPPPGFKIFFCVSTCSPHLPFARRSSDRFVRGRVQKFSSLKPRADRVD